MPVVVKKPHIRVDGGITTPEDVAPLLKKILSFKKIVVADSRRRTRMGQGRQSTKQTLETQLYV